MQEFTCIRQFADQQQIADCRTKITSAQKTLTKLSNLLTLAGNEVRLKILYLLEEERRLCPCDMADILGMTIPAVSQHLRKLKDGNIVETKKEGQTIYYSLTQENLKMLRHFFRTINLETQKMESTC